MKETLKSFLSEVNVLDVFKEKGHGDLKRWSAKRTVGGMIAGTACLSIMEHGMSWEAVVLCAISVVPLSISVFHDKTPEA